MVGLDELLAPYAVSIYDSPYVGGQAAASRQKIGRKGVDRTDGSRKHQIAQQVPRRFFDPGRYVPNSAARQSARPLTPGLTIVVDGASGGGESKGDDDTD